MTTKNNSPQLITLETIQSVLPQIDVFQAIKQGFIAYSKGEAVIPPVGELLFEEPPGEVHIKYGYIRSQPYYVVKIAAGFYNNPLLGLSSSQGMNLLFDKKNGLLCAILLDEGLLTDVRTAVAGAIASQALVAQSAKRIGIIGAGIQARMQLEYHRRIMEVEEVVFWNRNSEKAVQLAAEMQQAGQITRATSDLQALCEHCSLIITTTPSTSILIKEEWIQAGTHITAVGSDVAHKIELAPTLLERADVLVHDSLNQSQSRGEVFRAKQAGLLLNKPVIELGQLLHDPTLGRQNDQQITIADLTGVAVQDLMISQAVFEQINSSKK